MNNSSAGSRLTIFCGKGGVGKTSMALAFALWNADQGRPVLVVTSHPLRELAISVSLAGLKEAHPQAAANLYIIHIDAREVLANKVRQIVRSELLIKRVLASPIYKSLIEVAPGLKEIAFLGRLHQLSEERTEDGTETGVPAKYDLLIWDAPATGHFLQTLKVSQSFEMYLSGPFALLGREVAEFFGDVSNFALLPVTLLEEMAVDETIELCQKLASELKMYPTGVVCNMASPLLAASDVDFESLYNQMEQAGEAGENLQFIFDRQQHERSLFQKLRSSITTEFHRIERRPSWTSDLNLLWDLSRQLGGLLKT